MLLVGWVSSRRTYSNITLISGFKNLTVSLEGHSDESPSETRVESSPEDVQSDVGEARGHVTVNSQHHGVGAHNATSQDVQLWKSRGDRCHPHSKASLSSHHRLVLGKGPKT